MKLEAKQKADAEKEAHEAATRFQNLTAVLGEGEPHEGGRILTRLQGNIFLLNIIDLKKALRKVGVSEEKLKDPFGLDEDKEGNKRVSIIGGLVGLGHKESKLLYASANSENSFPLPSV